MRLFIASSIILDDYASIKEDFKDIIEGKWVKEENLHLTWVFLGDVENEKPVIDKLQNISPLENEVSIEEMGYFGRPPRVLFAKTEEKPLYNKAREFKEAVRWLVSFQATHYTVSYQNHSCIQGCSKNLQRKAFRHHIT